MNRRPVARDGMAPPGQATPARIAMRYGLRPFTVRVLLVGGRLIRHDSGRPLVNIAGFERLLVGREAT